MVGLSDVAQGTLLRLDLDAVARSPGVVDVISAGDIPGHRDIGPVFPGDPLFAETAVSYVGQPLFAVAATSYAAARRAVRAAVVEITPLTPRFDAVAAAAAGEFVAPPTARSAATGSRHWRRHPTYWKRVSSSVVRSTSISGRRAWSSPAKTRAVIVYTSNQHPSETQKLVAEVLDIPFHAVTVENRRMGGGFGGKETQAAPWACMAALLARRSGRAVRLRLPRAEDTRATGKRHPFHNRYRLGIDDTA